MILVLINESVVLQLNYLLYVVNFVPLQLTVTQSDPIPTHNVEKDQIFYTVYYNGIWIPNPNKDKGADSYRQFPWNKECMEWCYLIKLSTQPGFHTMPLFLLTKGLRNGAIFLGWHQILL